MPELAKKATRHRQRQHKEINAMEYNKYGIKARWTFVRLGRSCPGLRGRRHSELCALLRQLEAVVKWNSFGQYVVIIKINNAHSRSRSWSRNGTRTGWLAKILLTSWWVFNELVDEKITRIVVVAASATAIKAHQLILNISAAIKWNNS